MRDQIPNQNWRYDRPIYLVPFLHQWSFDCYLGILEFEKIGKIVIMSASCTKQLVPRTVFHYNTLKPSDPGTLITNSYLFFFSESPSLILTCPFSCATFTLNMRTRCRDIRLNAHSAGVLCVHWERHQYLVVGTLQMYSLMSSSDETTRISISTPYD